MLGSFIQFSGYSSRKALRTFLTSTITSVDSAPVDLTLHFTKEVNNNSQYKKQMFSQTWTLAWKPYIGKYLDRRLKIIMLPNVSSTESSSTLLV